MIDNRAVGKTIATLRQNRNMTQQQLAATLNVSHQAVSKWENGAALPDVQTLMDLTHLFGITMEQLLNGEVPQDRVAAKSPLEEPIQNIGNFVNSIVTGIFQPKKAESAEDEDDGAIDAEVGDGEADVTEEETTGNAQDGEEPETAEEPFDFNNLFRMAPFMTKPTLDAMLMEHRDQLTTSDIARFAPFISRECLEKLIQNPETEITWDTLQRVAPFLKREMVDKLTRAVATGNRIAREVASGNTSSGEDIGRAIGDFSQKIGSGMEKAVRKAAKLGEGVCNEVSNAINSFVESSKGRDARVGALRKAAMERALADGNWDWIAKHVDDVDDEDLRREIAQKANGLGMHDWVLEHLNGYADTRTIDAAIESGNWSWLGDHVWQFEDEFQEKIALAATQAENWQWLSTYAEQISLDHCADQIGVAAYNAGARVLALQLAEHCMNAAQRETLANAVVANGDYDFLRQIAEWLTPEYFGRLCVARAQEHNWDVVEQFVQDVDPKSVEEMMELAIAEGNFDAIDLLNPHL